MSVLTQFLERVRWPQAATKADDMLERVGSVFKSASQGADDMSRAILKDEFADWDRVEPINSWLRRGTKKVGRIVDEFQSPDMVFGRIEPGKMLWDTSVDATMAKQRFLMENVGSVFNKVTDNLPAEESQKVFKALEKPDLADTLTKPGRLAFDFFKGKYDFFKHAYINHLAEGDPTTYNKIIKMAAEFDKVTPEQLAELPDNVKKGIDFARRSIKDYAPHMFDRDSVVEHLTLQREKFIAKSKATNIPSEVKRWEEKAKEYQSSLDRLMGGEPLAWESLPKEFLFRHELVRKGKPGYMEDAVKTYKSYVYNLARKMYDEPATKTMAELYKQLPFEMRPYAKRYIRDFAGISGKSPLDEAAGVIANLQYWRTLGLNLRSALVNLTQQTNTLVDAGPMWSMKGYMRMFTKEGQELFKKTGLPMEVPQAFTQDLHPAAGWMEKVSRVMGTFFNIAEQTNRQHAFLTYLSRAEAKYGGATPQAIKEAIEGVHKTQFLYGKLGTPMVLRNPLGRIAGQYSSFTIKQAEFLRKLAKENPLKLAVMGGIYFQGGKTVGDVLGFDMSNALGFGLTFGEAIDVLRSLSDGELQEGVALARAAMTKGTGMLPSGPAPTPSMLLGLAERVGRGESIGEALSGELTPVAWARVEDAISNISARSEGKVPIRRYKGIPGFRQPEEVLYETTTGKALAEVAVKPTERVEKEMEWNKQRIMDQLESKRKRIIADAILNGQNEKAEKLMERYGVVPTREMLKEAILRRTLTREERKQYQMAKVRDLMRDEQRLSRMMED